MRPLHLLGLMPPEYRLGMPEGAPLMLPGAIPSGDQEVILAYFQQVITEHPLPRVEVDWYTMLLEPSRRLLENVLGERGSSGALVVVKIRQRGVNLRDVAEHPALRGFEHFAIANIHPGGTEELRGLLALTRDVTERAEELYEGIATRMGLRPEGWKLIDDFVRTLQNPVDVLETANALIEIQIEENPPKEHRKVILQRMLGRLLELRSAEDFAGLVGLATRGEEAAREVLGKDADAALGGLKVQGLFRDGKLRQWAAFLEKGEVWEGILGREDLPSKAQLTKVWADRVQEVVAWAQAKCAMFKGFRAQLEASTVKRELGAAIEAISEGRLARAREILVEIDQRLRDRDDVGHDARAAYWDTRSFLEGAEGHFEDAEMVALGRVYRRQGKLADAEKTLRAALHLQEEEGDTRKMRGVTMHELGIVLRDQEKLPEAEMTLRAALLVQREERDVRKMQGATMRDLGNVLRALGKEAEAEEMLREAQRLNDPAAS